MRLRTLVIGLANMFSLVWSDCANPMFQQNLTLPSMNVIQLSLLSQPENQIPFGNCQELDGSPSCCNITTFEPLVLDFEGLDSEIASRIQQIQQTTPQEIVDLVLADLEYTLNAKQNSLALLLAASLKQLLDPAVQCYGGYLGYYQGMLCFSCHPDWAHYYWAINNTLSLSTSTCDGIWGECSWFFENFQSFLLDAISLVIQILQADDNPSKFARDIAMLQEALSLLNLQTFCQAHESCRDLLCNDVLHGIILPDLTPRNNGENRLAMHMKRLLTVGFRFMSLTFRPPQNLPAFLAYLPRIFDQQLTASANSIQAEKLESLAAPPTKNVYTSKEGDGYTAYSVGCQASLSQYACPIPHSLSTSDNETNLVLYILLPVFLTLGLLVFYYLWKRKKPQEAVALDENVRYIRLPDPTADGETSIAPAKPDIPPSDGSIQ